MDKENVVHMHNGALFSYKEQNLVFARNWMQMETLTLNKISQTQANTVFPHAEGRFKMETKACGRREEQLGIRGVSGRNECGQSTFCTRMEGL